MPPIYTLKKWRFYFVLFFTSQLHSLLNKTGETRNRINTQ